ncbi:MAG TPA: arginine--tRNA ligase, partial [Candidatus Poseidoniales archaeon]|nr:arginine--tRNA ligase [Candidatus Poseidoniales archaeon]
RKAEHPDLAACLDSATALGGYLNLRARAAWMAQSTTSRQSIGHLLESGDKVLIEHTSANPNGPFHVGRARNAIIGDTLVRLNRLAGNKVRAEYYVDDMGKQVGILSWAMNNLTSQQVDEILQAAGLESGTETGDGGRGANPWSDKPDHQRVRWYQAANVLLGEDESVDAAVGEMVRRSEEGDVEVLERFVAAYQPVLDGMLETLERLGIEYDTFTRESRFVSDGSVGEVMAKLAASPLHEVAENGAHYLELSNRGITGKSTKFFYQRGDGSSLYATRDVAYHQWKWTQCDRLVNILGEDHKLQSKQVAIALVEVGQIAPEVVFYSFIKLPEGKMSTRRGQVVYMDDLLEEAKQQAYDVVEKLRRDELDESAMWEIAEAVGRSAVRFNIIKVAPEKGFTFRWEDALAFEAGSAPFIMYSHARACAIRRRVTDEGHDVSAIVADYSHREKDFASAPSGLVELLRVMETYDEVLTKAVEESRPHLFAKHILALANTYNGFYRDCHVIAEGEVNQMHLAISEAARNMLHAGCEGLGIIPLHTM